MFGNPFEDIRRGIKIAFSDLRWVSLIFLFAAADQLTKLLIIASFELYEAQTVIPALFSIVYVQNRGAAFGIFSGFESPMREVVLFGATVIALSVVFTFLGSAVGANRVGKFALALVCGGAVGNLVDRIRLGYVVDFLDFHIGRHHWPAFNLADSCICIGVAILVFLPKPQRLTEKISPPASAL